MRHAVTVLAALVLFSAGARADTACVSALFTPDTYAAPPGGVFLTFVTLGNCSENYVFFGDTGGNAPWDLLAIDSLDFPGRLLGPGASVTDNFSFDMWQVNAEPGSVWNATAAFSYDIYEGWCDNISVPCVSLGGGVTHATFTAVVSEPPSEIPEPATALLLTTGLVGVAARLRKKRLQGGRSSYI